LFGCYITFPYLTIKNISPSKTGDAPQMGTLSQKGLVVFAAKSWYDLDLQGSDPNVACDTLSQYGDHFSEIVLKSDFKSGSYGPDIICCKDMLSP